MHTHRLPTFRRRSFWLGAAVASAILAAGSLAFMALDDSAAPSIEAAAVPQAVFAQFGETSDTIYAAPIDAVDDRREVTRIGHAEGWGIIGAASPDGRWLAYTVLPEGGRRPQRDAEAHLLSLTGDGDRLVARGVDLQSQPVWAAASDRVAFVRGEAREDAASSFTIIVAAVAGGAQDWGPVDDVLAAHVAGFAADEDAVLIAVTTTGGTRLESLTADGRRADMAALSSGIARDLTLSPDGSRLAYVDASSAASGGLEVRVADLGDTLAGAAVPATGEPTGTATLGPAWSPDGDLTIGIARAGGAALLLEGDLTAAEAKPVGAGERDGFDIPISWAPDGTAMAVQQVSGELGAVRGLRLAVLGPSLGRQPFGDADTKFLGWVPATSP